MRGPSSYRPKLLLRYYKHAHIHTHKHTRKHTSMYEHTHKHINTHTKKSNTLQILHESVVIWRMVPFFEIHEATVARATAWRPQRVVMMMMRTPQASQRTPVMEGGVLGVLLRVSRRLYGQAGQPRGRVRPVEGGGVGGGGGNRTSGKWRRRLHSVGRR